MVNTVIIKVTSSQNVMGVGIFQLINTEDTDSELEL